ncbi:hypothetical protein Q2T76_04725 [Lactobacillus sp. YT155]|uniref:hypothetical protein n=1 Tax=Lactobacillus sp. YT155 TaxID=3060955 RepID=UPI002660017C|nr:hypothetical protein [Lactobacillus sp. YT155]MDO1605361.1 hypothetical protein [Lactobacillus sp. YT155]
MTKKNPIEEEIAKKTEKVHTETNLINKKTKRNSLAIITSVLLFSGIMASLILIIINILSK